MNLSPFYHPSPSSLKDTILPDLSSLITDHNLHKHKSNITANMIPQITFPAHTQARMAAAKAAKEAKKPIPAVSPPGLSGHVHGLSIDDRQEIIQCSVKVIVGYGTIEAFHPLVKDVNLVMLQHCKYRHYCTR